MTLSNAQIAKLTPEQRRARNKAIAYKRAYHAKRRAEIAQAAPAQKRGRPSKGPSVIAKTLVQSIETTLNRVNVLKQEMVDTEAKLASIRNELGSLLNIQG